MIKTPLDRRVITFYSYKGGAGRTMALANVAYRLANTHGLDVIVVDWDLEAPGLHSFFGISHEVAARTNGILDYFLAWGAAVRRNDPKPPPEERDVVSWVLPVEDAEHKPKFGAVSVLLAGKQDRGYDKRLAGFDWEAFYAREAGAAAVENLREKLVGRADVVLIDSRTGRTDAGGICTIQLPDGVVLLTAPNEQSLDGTEMVARSIARATTEQRAERGRGRVRMWQAMARVASVEESYLAEEWFKQHAARFEKGIEEGLWLKEDHPEGMRSLEIPQVGRWGFGESVLRPGPDVGSRDALALAYERLTETLLRWINGEPPRRPVRPPSTRHAPTDMTPESAVAEAERRGDISGLGFALLGLAASLNETGRAAEAVRKLEQAIGIFMSRGARSGQAVALGMLGTILSAEPEHLGESNESLTKSIALARELGDKETEANGLKLLATNKVAQGADEEALQLFERAHAIEEMLEEPLPQPPRTVRSIALYRTGHEKEAEELFRQELSAAQQMGDTDAEKDVIGTLLELTAADPLPDADALRARLTELEALKPSPTQPSG